MDISSKSNKHSDRGIHFRFWNVSSLILEIIIILPITFIKNIFRLLVVVMVLLQMKGEREIDVNQEADGE